MKSTPFLKPIRDFEHSIQPRYESRLSEVKNLYDEKKSRELLTNVFWGEEFHIRLPEEVSSSLYLKGHVEPRLSAFYYHVLQPGKTVLDVGAHFGYFSRLASFCVQNSGQVFSFEPMPTTREFLIKNTERKDNIKVVPYAGWHQKETLSFLDYGIQWSAYSTAYQARLPETFLKTLPSQRVSVQAVDLDSWCKENQIRADLIKIDAESAELQVIEGMNQILSHDRPLVTVEVGDLRVPEAPKSREVLQKAQHLGYLVYELTDTGVCRHLLKDHYEYDNLILVPEESLHTLESVFLEKGFTYA